MALRHSAFYSPLLMTMAGGFLREQGLDYRYTVATPEHTIPESIANGSCHLAQSAVATSFAALERGDTLKNDMDIVHFAQINALDGFFIAAREPDRDFNWGKLSGRRVLVDHLFQPLAMLKFALHRMEVDYAALQVVDAGNVEAIEQAFRNGEGDYVHMQGPVPQQLQHEGAGYVVAAVGDVVGPVAFSSLCASREWLQSQMATAFMQAYKQALAYVVAAPADEIAAREQEAGFFPTIEPQVLTSTLQAYQQLGCWNHDGTIAPADYDNLLQVFLYSGLISRRYPYDAAIVTL